MRTRLPRRTLRRSAFPLALAALLVVASGCSSDDDGDRSGDLPQAALAGPTWVWDGFRATPDGEIEPAPTDPGYSIRFASADGGETGSYNGSTECNDYGGSYVSGGTLFETVPGPMTDATCDDEDAAAIEVRFLGTLAMAATFGLEDDRLTIVASDGAALIFTDETDPN